MSIREAKTDFFSPMTGNVSGGRRTRDNLIMKAIKTKMVKTDHPYTKVGQQKTYAPKEDTKSISDSSGREEEEASAFLQKAVKKVEKPDTSTSEPPTQTKPDPKPTTQPKPTPKPTTTEKAKKAVTVAKKVSSGSCPYGDGGYTGSLKGFCPYTQAEAVATKGYMSVADKKRIDNERIQAALARMN